MAGEEKVNHTLTFASALRRGSSPPSSAVPPAPSRMWHIRGTIPAMWSPALTINLSVKNQNAGVYTVSMSDKDFLNIAHLQRTPLKLNLSRLSTVEHPEVSPQTQSHCRMAARARRRSGDSAEKCGGDGAGPNVSFLRHAGAEESNRGGGGSAQLGPLAKPSLTRSPRAEQSHSRTVGVKSQAVSRRGQWLPSAVLRPKNCYSVNRGCWTWATYKKM